MALEGGLNQPQHSLAMVYLHGFLSSPQAAKATILDDALTAYQLPVTFYRPAIADKPSQAIPALSTFVAALKQQYARVILIGSSLGGFYAHHLAEQFDLSCVLINPLVDAKLKMQELDESIAGALENPYTHNIFSIDDADKRAVENFATCSDAAKPLNKLILLQMADEVLDARLAARYYRQSPCIISAGGHHQFEHFERYSLTIFKWLGLC